MLFGDNFDSCESFECVHVSCSSLAIFICLNWLVLHVPTCEHVFPSSFSFQVWGCWAEAVVSSTGPREGKTEAETDRGQSDIPCEGVFIAACHACMVITFWAFVCSLIQLATLKCKNHLSNHFSSAEGTTSCCLWCSHSSWLSISNWRCVFLDAVHVCRCLCIGLCTNILLCKGLWWCVHACLMSVSGPANLVYEWFHNSL